MAATREASAWTVTPRQFLALSWGRTVVEFRQFTRVPEQVFFTFLLPILFLVIFGTVFDEQLESGDGRSIDFIQYFVPGIIAALGEQEYGRTWGPEWPIAMLAIWIVISFVLALVFFRWAQQSDR